MKDVEIWNNNYTIGIFDLIIYKIYIDYSNVIWFTDSIGFDFGNMSAKYINELLDEYERYRNMDRRQ